MEQFSQLLREQLQRAAANHTALAENRGQLESFAEAARLIVASYLRGGRLYVAGNGGSAADAQHLVAELVVRLKGDRDPIAAEALTVDASVLTAMGNDYSFDELFARQLRAKLQANDVFLALSTSGKSPNIVNALKVCREKDVPSVLFTGRGGGVAKDWATVSVDCPGEDASQVQEVHIALYHCLCQIIESALSGKGKT